MKLSANPLRTALRSTGPLILSAALLAIVQLALSGSDEQAFAIILMSAGVNVILAVSLNIVNGFTGQFSLGHAGFMAVGAYTAAKISLGFKHLQELQALHPAALPPGVSHSLSFLAQALPPGVPDQAVFFLALGAGMATAALAGLLVGMPSLRLRGDYLAIVTLGFNEIIRVVIENTPFLGMATGLSGVPRHTTIVWVGMGAIVTVLVSRRLLGSTHGRALLAIREDEVAAEAMGVDTTGYKVRAFVISAALAGLAGGLLVHLIQLCTPRSFSFVRSIEVVVMVVLGGMGSVSGSIVAALGLSFALEGLREFQQYRMALYAVLLIVLMLVRPTGIFGRREIWDWDLSWLLGRKRATAKAGEPEPRSGP